MLTALYHNRNTFALSKLVTDLDSYVSSLKHQKHSLQCDYKNFFQPCQCGRSFTLNLRFKITAQDAGGAGRALYQVVTILWIFIGLAWVAIVLSDIGDYFTKTVEEEAQSTKRKKSQVKL